MNTDRRYWAVKCPHCNQWQCKEAVIFGKTSEKATCIYCGKKILLPENGESMGMKDAQAIVMKKNSQGNNELEFKTYRRKNGEKHNC